MLTGNHQIHLHKIPTKLHFPYFGIFRCCDTPHNIFLIVVDGNQKYFNFFLKLFLFVKLVAILSFPICELGLFMELCGHHHMKISCDVHAPCNLLVFQGWSNFNGNGQKFEKSAFFWQLIGLWSRTAVHHELLWQCNVAKNKTETLRLN